MKNKITRTGLLIGFIFSMFAFADAQTVSQFRVSIPFDFTVRDKSFRAGDYSVNLGGLTQSRKTLLIRSANGKTAALWSVMPEESYGESNTPTLVFILDENGYSLVELKTRRVSAKIRRGKADTRLTKNFKSVELALKR